MIQFNLLPDIKQEYIKALKTKRMVVSVSTMVIIAITAVVALLCLTVLVVQRRHLGNLNSNIKNLSTELKDQDINKILTIQNQLNSLPGLHEQKPEATRLFGYLRQLTPNQVTIARSSIDFTTGVVEVSGESPAITDVNQFTDTLKFTKYTIGTSEEQKNAFSEVVLSSFSRAEKVSYQIQFKFDTEIFANTQEVKLVVPNITSTRSTVEKPTELFREGVQR